MTNDRGRARRQGRRLQPGRLLPLLLAGLAAAAGVLVAGSGAAVAQGDICPTSNPPNMLVVAAGSPQSGQLEKPFETKLQVKLANTNGCELTGQLAGVPVHFSAPGSGASGTFAGSGTTGVTVGTDASGVATAPTFTANDSAGSYSVRADSGYGSVGFWLTNSASGVVATITAGAPSEQAATVNSQYGQPLQAQVLDANGRPVQGASVTFSLGTGPTGASASFLGGGAQATATTKPNGLATSPPFVANGTPGRFTAAAATSGIATAASFALSNHAATTALSAASNAEQTATVGTRYRQPLVARVLDANGQPIEGASVSFSLRTAASGAGASFLGGESQATALTDAAGQATSPPFVANATPGRFNATAIVGGSATPLSYPLRNLAGTLTAGREAHTAVVDSRYHLPLRARVLDRNGQPVDGASVTFTIGKATGGATATFPDGTSQATATTDPSGYANSPPLLANATAGRFTANATITGNGKPVSYRLENVAGAPASITAGDASGQSAPVGSRFPVRLAVTLEDANSNPVAGATVTFAAPAHGPSGRFSIRSRTRTQLAVGKKRPARVRAGRIVRVKTNDDGVAIAPAFTANATPGGYIVTASAGGQRAAFALVNRPR